MKTTDYCPRAAPMDSFLTGKGLVGIEVGTDVGAHAEALLMYGDIQKIYLVDIWDKEYYQGYCQGRLRWYRHKIEYIPLDSHTASLLGDWPMFDFIYIDIPHDYATVKQSLEDWWFKLKDGGVMGYRNYAAGNPELVKAVDEFLAEHEHTSHEVIMAEMIIKK